MHRSNDWQHSLQYTATEMWTTLVVEVHVELYTSGGGTCWTTDLHCILAASGTMDTPPTHRVWTSTELLPQIHTHTVSSLVFNVPFQHKYMAISRTKGQGWRAIPTQYRKASDILTSTLAAFLFSSHPKRERDREAHLNYYTSADSRERQVSYTQTDSWTTGTV